MPPRDEQDFEERRQQIIDGALQVFADKGFERATNKDIAQAAGINSPGLIYHYFKDKASLLEQAIENRSQLFRLLANPDHLHELPPREALSEFARGFLSITENPAAIAVFKLMFSEAVRRPSVAEVYNRLGPTRAFRLLSSYLSQQMERGTLRHTDVGAAARCFVGPLLAFIVTREIFPQPDTATLDIDTMVTTLVDVYLQGMQP